MGTKNSTYAVKCTMTIGTPPESKTFPVQGVVWKEFVPPLPKAGSAEIKPTIADNLEWVSFLPEPRGSKILMPSTPSRGKSVFSRLWEERQKEEPKSAVPSLREGLVAFYEPRETNKPFAAEMHFYPRALDSGEIVKLYFDGMKEEENVNYLFEVFVIDLKNRELVGSHYVICGDVPRAVAVATLRHELKEDELSSLEFHVHRICEVPAWEG